MNLKKLLVLSNLVLAMVLSLTLFLDYRRLNRENSADVTLKVSPLPEIQRPLPTRLASFRNIFDLELPPPPAPSPAAASDPALSAPQPAPAEIQAPGHRIRLDGIILTGSRKVATFLIAPATADQPVERLKLSEGEEMFHFVLKKIESHRVFLFDKTSQQEVELVIFKNNLTKG